MTHSLPHLQGLLLDMLSTHRQVEPSAIEALGGTDWEILLRMVHQHRLGPLLYWRLTRERSYLSVPEVVKTGLAAGYKRATLRALVMQRDLLLTHRILNNAGIPHVALKGAFLAFNAYPHPALRPLRDLDILVPKESVLHAYQVLQDGGLSRRVDYKGDPSACAELHKHLPPLGSSSGQTNIELHLRLFGHQTQGMHDLADDPELWLRTIHRNVACESLEFLSVTDLLFHLIVHAVDDHLFNNGPLLFSDIAFLLEMHSIDWILFWQLAEKHGQTRASLLAFKLVERYYGALPVQWPENFPDLSADMSDVIETASLLSLQDFFARGNAALSNDINIESSRVRKFRLILSRVFPSRTKIAANYPVSPNSIMVFPFYIGHWWRIITQRLPGFLKSRRGSQYNADVRGLNYLSQWLRT